ncbi:DUF1737 domain-containing protein [Tenacibaculum ovolyticum]|uniref:DUF1737 domain-containing protein n=1 Tax=Tenacibaculum ovolyticum TaxID=104270 RepID=UPI0009ED9241|nr:DUF1737 domain-containing protein [Tenacibaculum ovolyticum]
MKYEIITAATPSVLSIRINKFLKEGYLLQGGVASGRLNGNYIFTQAITKSS